MSARRAKGRGPFLHLTGTRKAMENSPAGLRLAVEREEGIDLDTRMTAPTGGVRTFANGHDDDLSKRYVWTKASERVARELGIPGVVAGRSARRRISKTPWRLVSTAVSRAGRHPIRSIASQIALGGRLGLRRIEHEPKDVPTVAEFRKVYAAAARAYGPEWRSRYLVKRLKNIPGWKTCLENAHTADPQVTTMLINIGPIDPKTLPPYVKEYRR